MLTALTATDAEKQRAMAEYERKMREQAEMAQRRAGGSVFPSPSSRHTYHGAVP